MIVEILKFKKLLPDEGKILGLDYGAKNIGAAISDSTRTLASAYKAYDAALFWRELPLLLEREKICAIIVGNPRLMSGKDSQMTLAAQKFAQKIDAAFFELPLAFWDERLSSVAAERILVEQADLSRAKRAKLVDRLASAIILQGALDYLKNPG